MLHLQGYSPTELFSPLSQCFEKETKQNNLPSKTFPCNSALNNASNMFLLKYVHIENIHCLFLGLTGVGRPNQKIFLDFYSLCPLCLLIMAEGIRASK